jgi:hypothetical protein
MLIMNLLRHNFYLQIFLLLAISIVFQLMILGSKPMLKKLDNRMLLFNELMVSIYLYLLLCLTDFMGDHDKRDLIAWALLIAVVFTVVVNLVKFLLVCDWCYLIRKIKKKCLKLKKYEMGKQDTNKNFDEETSIAGGNLDKGKKNKRLKRKKKIIKKKKKLTRPAHKINQLNNDEIFKIPAKIEDPTLIRMNEHSYTVAYDLGGELCYHLDEDEEIKQEIRK